MEFYGQINMQNRISPLYPSDHDILAKVKKDTVLKFSIVQQRSYQFHKKMFALFNIGFDNQEMTCIDSDGVEVAINFDHYRKYVIMKAGFYDIVQSKKGAIYFPKSISYSNMSNNEFEVLFNRVLDVIADLLQSKPFDIRNQIDDFM